MSELLQTRHCNTPSKASLAAAPLLVAAALLLPALAAAQTAPTLPENGWIVWASDREDGRHEIYRMRADGTDITRLTHEGAHMAAWSPDGQWIAYRSLLDETVYVMRPDGSAKRQIFARRPTPKEPSKIPPFWLHDNSGVVSADGDTYYLIDPETAEATRLFSIREFSPIGQSELNVTSMSVDRRWIFGYSNAYANGLTGTNGTFRSGPYVAVAVDMEHKDDIYFIGDGCEPVLSDDGATLFHINRAHYVARMSFADLDTRASYQPEVQFPYDEFGYMYFPRLSSDNRWITFGGSQACHDHKACDYEISIHRVGAEVASHTRLTFNTANDQWPHLFVGELGSSREGGGCTLAPPGAWTAAPRPLVALLLFSLVVAGLAARRKLARRASR